MTSILLQYQNFYSISDLFAELFKFHNDKIYAPSVAYIGFFPKFKPNLLVTRVFFLNANFAMAFNFICTFCITSYWATHTAEVFHILQLFLTYHNYTKVGCLQILIAWFCPHSFPFHSILELQLVYQSCPVVPYLLFQ